jgi:transcription elongation GreA/GreB family factor
MNTLILNQTKEFYKDLNLDAFKDDSHWININEDAIKFGATVTVVDEDTDEEKTWQIVGEHEANIEKGLLNVKSPIARALIGKDAGDSVEVRTPGGEKSYEVLSVNYT